MDTEWIPIVEQCIQMYKRCEDTRICHFLCLTPVNELMKNADILGQTFIKDKLSDLLEYSYKLNRYDFVELVALYKKCPDQQYKWYIFTKILILCEMAKQQYLN